MLQDSKSFSSFSVNDLPLAKKFYMETLGISTSSRMESTLELDLSDGNKVMLYEKPNHVPATFTVLNFVVQNVEQTVDQLIAKGVRFEQYSGEIQTDEKGIFRGNGPKIAWFKDPAGNILSVLENNP
ncbi:VOC family protein [Chitinophagaceae bacterium MMS25-I14]